MDLPLTYRELQQAVLSLSPCQLTYAATYYDMLAYIPICEVCAVASLPEDDRDELDGVLESDQIVLVSATRTHANTFITYKNLLTSLSRLSDAQLDTSVTFYNVDEMEAYGVYDHALLSEVKALIRHDMPETEDYPLLCSAEVVIR